MLISHAESLDLISTDAYFARLEVASKRNNPFKNVMQPKMAANVRSFLAANLYRKYEADIVASLLEFIVTTRLALRLPTHS